MVLAQPFPVGPVGVVDGADDAAGIPGRDDVRRDILRYHGTRSDDGTSADADPGVNDGIAAYPYGITDMDGLAVFQP